MSDRRGRRVVLWTLSLLVVGCLSPSKRAGPLLGAGRGDSQIQEACAVTQETCTHCHEIDRVLVAKFDSPGACRRLVERMRLTRSSGITDVQANQAVMCLTYRTFGWRGLIELRAKGGRP